MHRSKEIMAARDIERTLDRLACQILEQITDHESIALVGIQRRGADLACRLCGLLSERTRRAIPCGELDINLYRDDWTSSTATPNINATRIALQGGLQLPLCYNTSGYERAEIVELLDGIVDIYLPDLKFMDGAEAERYNLAAAADYPAMAQEAIIEMHRQVGVAEPAADGIMERGLIIRHLVMPNNQGGSDKIMEWIAAHLPPATYVNIMAQYTPLYKAFDFPEISRRITPEEYRAVVEVAENAGLTNLDLQGFWWLRR